MPRRVFSTHCDKSTLMRTVALAESITSASPDGLELHCICHDELSRTILDHLAIAGVHTVPLHRIEAVSTPVPPSLTDAIVDTPEARVAREIEYLLEALPDVDEVTWLSPAALLLQAPPSGSLGSRAADVMLAVSGDVPGHVGEPGNRPFLVRVERGPAGSSVLEWLRAGVPAFSIAHLPATALPSVAFEPQGQGTHVWIDASDVAIVNPSVLIACGDPERLIDLESDLEAWRAVAGHLFRAVRRVREVLPGYAFGIEPGTSDFNRFVCLVDGPFGRSWAHVHRDAAVPMGDDLLCFVSGQLATIHRMVISVKEELSQGSADPSSLLARLEGPFRDSHAFMALRGEVAMASGDSREAERWFSEVLNKDPHHGDALSGFLRAAMAGDDTDRALNLIRRFRPAVLTCFPALAASVRFLSSLHLPQEAFGLIRDGLLAGSNPPEALALLEECKFTGLPRGEQRQLPDARGFNLLLDHQDREVFSKVVRAFLSWFSGEDDVALHVFAGSQVDEVSRLVLEAIETLGLDTESIPDLCIHESTADLFQIGACHMVLGRGVLASLAGRLGIPCFESALELVRAATAAP
ncbi:MAG: hypothetical protein VKP72_13530 [bacterium]|nr:hypothetical protein [bacterium]